MSTSISNLKTILITGASSGIGLAASKLFYTKGWNVIATMRSPSKAPEELKALQAETASNALIILGLNVEDTQSIATAILAGLERFSRIDVLLNNAGFSLNGIFESLSDAKIREQFEVNVFGLMNVTRAILPHLRSHKSGGIINIGSGAGTIGFPLLPAYAASKFAVEGFTEALSWELASQGLFTKIVIPLSGVTATNFVQRGMEDVAPTMAAIPADYNEWLGKAWGLYEGMMTRMKDSGKALTAGDVADAVYEAAMDGYGEEEKSKLRYCIGPDDIGIMKARSEAKDHEEYMARAKAIFNM